MNNNLALKKQHLHRFIASTKEVMSLLAFNLVWLLAK